MSIYLTADEQAQILLDAARGAYPRVCDCPFPFEICDHSYASTCLANRVRAQGIVAQERIERERKLEAMVASMERKP